MRESSPPHREHSHSSSESLEKRLKHHPDLKAKTESLLAVVENTQADVDKANAAQQRVIEEIQQLGQAALQGGRIDKISNKWNNLFNPTPKPSEVEEKLYWYSRFGPIEVIEHLFSHVKGKGTVRSFRESAKVNCRGYSLPLQQIITSGALFIGFLSAV